MSKISRRRKLVSVSRNHQEHVRDGDTVLALDLDMTVNDYLMTSSTEKPKRSSNTGSKFEQNNLLRIKAGIICFVCRTSTGRIARTQRRVRSRREREAPDLTAAIEHAKLCVATCAGNSMFMEIYAAQRAVLASASFIQRGPFRPDARLCLLDTLNLALSSGKYGLRRRRFLSF